MRTIGLEGMRFHVPLGIHEEEKLMGNEIEVNLQVTVNSAAVKEDHLEETLNYEQMHDVVKKILNEDINLLETACTRIIEGVSKLDDSVVLVKVRVTKFNPPVEGRVEKVFVEEEWVRIVLNAK